MFSVSGKTTIASKTLELSASGFKFDIKIVDGYYSIDLYVINRSGVRQNIYVFTMYHHTIYNRQNTRSSYLGVSDNYVTGPEVYDDIVGNGRSATARITFVNYPEDKGINYIAYFHLYVKVDGDKKEIYYTVNEALKK